MGHRADDRNDLLAVAARSAVGFAVDRVCGLPRLGVEGEG